MSANKQIMLNCTEVQELGIFLICQQQKLNCLSLNANDRPRVQFLILSEEVLKFNANTVVWFGTLTFPLTLS